MDDVTVRLIVSLAWIAGGIGVAWILVRVAGRSADDDRGRYYARKFIRYGTAAAVAVALVVIWQPFGAQFAAVFGLMAAGITFAMQEVIGAVAGWFNITFGRIFSVGDRIQMGGVHGDVIDISPLRTKLMEIGSSSDPEAWVRGRQHTGRMVAISNKATFTQPVFNYSAFFDFIWEEVEVAVPHHGDHVRAAAILREEAARVSQSDEAIAAMRELRTRFPVPDTELVPQVFASADESVMRLAARFVVPTRAARTAKDDLVRRVHARLEDAGVEIVVTSVIQEGPSWQPVEDAGDDGA